MLTDLALSALTDVILACLVFFLSGLSLRGDVQAGSPAMVWSGALILTGTSIMLGAIDHGFYEPVGHPAHDVLVSATRVSVVLASFCMLWATAIQFLSPAQRRLVLGVGGLLGLGAAALIVSGDNFLVVIGYYSAAMLLLLFHCVRAARAEPGWWAMVVGIAITFAASALPFTGTNGVFGLGLYGTYHVILMPAVIGLYLGGRTFRRARG